jgi:hypothetical protein
MADIDERQKKAFDFVSDYTKQLITLATGIITFMVTFLGDEVKSGPDVSKWCLIVSWGFFTLSICFGIMRLMALTGNLDPVDPKKQPNLTIGSDNVRTPGKLQIFTFLLALLLSVIFGVIQLFHIKKKDVKENTTIIIQQRVSAAGTTLSKDTLYPLNQKNKTGKPGK